MGQYKRRDAFRGCGAMIKTIKHRKLHGVESPAPCFVELGGNVPLSSLLATNNGDKLFLVGSSDRMTRDYMLEPLRGDWEISGQFVFKHRTAEYHCRIPPTRRVTVKLASHRDSWFPGCEDASIAFKAWQALMGEWPKNVPLLSSPAATGKALLWESLPCKDGAPVEFPSLDDDLATLIRANSPQHRIESVNGMGAHEVDVEKAGHLWACVQYDGRWMYAAMCSLDRFPIGTPKRIDGFKEYQPGIYSVRVRIPEAWNHIGLLPVKEDAGNGAMAWCYPSTPGMEFQTWAFEPELTLAVEGVKKFDLPPWEIMEIYDGYSFEKGRPLLGWSDKLIKMRDRLQKAENFPVSGVNDEDLKGFPDVAKYRYAASAVRQILNHTIGAMHRNDYEREMFISGDNFRKWRRENPGLASGEDRTPSKVEGGYMVPTFVRDNSPLSIYMPHWSSTLYSCARARVAEWALLCDPSTIVKINGDAIYSTVEQPELDKLDTGRNGQPRRK